MTENKLKIDLIQGIIEVEGSEQLVRDIYNDFKERLNKEPVPVVSTSTPQPQQPLEKKQPARSKAKRTASKPKAKKSSGKSGALLKELDLTGSSDIESLRDFYNKYEAATNLERNLVFVYYLQNIKEIEEININHVFTCYRNIQDLKSPGSLKQSIVDTGFKKGWLDTSNMENIIVPISGINHLEHDLPKKATEAS